MITPELQLRLIIAMAQPRLEAIPDGVASQPRAPGKWSRKEIVGHLIDSASNNHQRFVRAQFTDDLICAPYDQDAWVSSQRYGSAPWRDLIVLWAQFNAQIARVMDAMPAEVRSRARARHNLDEVAFGRIPKSDPTTLEYFMRDYVAHLEHHLAQILGPPSHPSGL